jgi:glycosyltransferase involved in cell wall biosynthesis
MGHQVTIVTYHNGKGVPGVDVRRTLPIPWRKHYEVGSSRHKLAFDLLLALRTLDLLVRGWFTRQQYDVIHAHLHEGALLAHSCGHLFGVPVVFDFQGSLTEEMIDHNFLRRESIFYRPLRRLEEWIDQRSRVIFTSSTPARPILLEHFGCTEQQVRALPDCVDTDTFQPASHYAQADLQALRAELGLPPTAKIIVYLGLLARYQGTDLLLEAMQRILQQRSDVYLLLMGFPGMDIYRHKAASLGVIDNVRITGRIPYAEAPRYLALGDVAVAPKLSLTESAGKLLNYMAIGIPTVAFDTPVAREFLGEHGLLARSGDAAALAEALLQAFTMPTLGEKLRQRAVTHFNWRNAGQTIVAAYSELTARRAADAPVNDSNRGSTTEETQVTARGSAVAQQANPPHSKTGRSKWLRSKGMVIQE